MPVTQVLQVRHDVDETKQVIDVHSGQARMGSAQADRPLQALALELRQDASLALSSWYQLLDDDQVALNSIHSLHQ